MKSYKIYTAGKMAGLPYEDQMKWRLEIESLIRERTDKHITFIHPPLYYTYGIHEGRSEKEVKEWDLSQVKDCDIVIVNLENISSSIGTHYELATVDAMNSFGHKHIYLIGIGKPDTDHPWIKLSLLRHEEDWENAADYIANYLLV